ncbi:MAG TPA: hypothetical protein VIT91_18035 [Chthoniobacterales bacterium]
MAAIENPAAGEMGVTTRFAHWVSVVAHPFVMVAIMVGTATARLDRSGDIVSNIGIVLLFAILPVVVLTVRQVRRGAWANADASNPRDRPVLYAVGIAGLLALMLYLTARQPDSFLVRGTSVALLMLAVCAITTIWVKVSIHVATAALAATTLILLGSPVGWGGAVVVPILMWSRLALGRHKPLEVAFGLVFGILAGIATRFP